MLQLVFWQQNSKNNYLHKAMRITSLLNVFYDLQLSSLFFSSKTFEIHLSLDRNLSFIKICQQSFANIYMYLPSKSNLHAQLKQRFILNQY